MPAIRRSFLVTALFISIMALLEYAWWWCVHQAEGLVEMRLLVWGVSRTVYDSVINSQDWSKVWVITLWTPLILAALISMLLLIQKLSPWHGIALIVVHIVISAYAYFSIENQIAIDRWDSWIQIRTQMQIFYDAIRIDDVNADDTQ